MSPENIEKWAASSKDSCLQYITTPDDPTITRLSARYEDGSMHRGICHSFNSFKRSWSSWRVVSEGGDWPEWMEESSLRTLREKRKKEEESSKESCILM
jgi:hypothetical protein